MPINPHIGDDVAATAWYDQFQAELQEKAYDALETCLHVRGLCSASMGKGTLELMDDALQSGALAMAQLLEGKGRIKESGDPIDNGLLAGILRKMVRSAGTVEIGEHNEQAELTLDNIAEVELTQRELAMLREVLGK